MKNYVLVGGSSGIGLELVKLLCHEHRIFIFSRSNDQLTDLQNVQHHHFDVMTDTLDIAILPDVVDGFIYCPGSINLKPFGRIKEEDFLLDYRLNFLGAAKSIQTILGSLKKSPNAAIVLFSTVATTIGMPYHASIASSKSALEGLSKSLAAELAPHVRVNVIAPSLTATKLAEKLISSPEKLEASNKRHPLGRIGSSLEIAKTAQFLLSEDAAWMTGQVIHIDGGISAIKTS